MKKWLVVLLSVAGLFLLGVYIFIPAHLTVTKIELVRCSPDAVQRILSNKNKWPLWWPGTGSKQSDSQKQLSYKGITYQLSQQLLSGVIISTRNNQLNSDGIIQVLPLGKDSAAIEWKTDVATNGNPIQKITLYQQARGMKGNMTEILSRAKSFLEKQENVYGMQIAQTKVTDTVLVATKSVTTSETPTKVVYNMIGALKEYIRQQGAAETNPPMMHVRALDSSRFETMVAIPVNKVLPENKKFLLKRMVPGNILVAEVRGGPYTVREGYRQLNNYVNDHDRTSPAIPFESLVTDRSKEADTSKWITRLYFPVY